MDSKKKFVNSVVRFTFVCFLAYASLFYIAPFIASLTSKVFNIGSGVKVTNIVQTPQLINFKNTTNQDKINVEGASSAGAEVELTLNDNSYGKMTAESDGRFKFENVEILKGMNKISLKAKDNTGVQSETSKVYEIEFDDKKPEIKEINLKNGDEIKNLNKTIKIIGETTEKCDIEINGKKVFIVSENKFEYLLGVEEGGVTVNIKLKDKAGNEQILKYNVSYKKG
jgi:hypothetical protein